MWKLIKNLKLPNFLKMATIVINNNSHVGRSVVISGNKIIIDGKDVTPDGKEINITVDGPIDQLQVDVCNKISVKGDVAH
jgi:hypothetical protein